jgi:uncharacterized membrane protein (DUF441 family)
MVDQCRVLLFLLVLGIFANNTQVTITADHLAFITHLFYSGSYFHKYFCMCL